MTSPLVKETSDVSGFLLDENGSMMYEVEWESCGQSEPLTQRLRNILRDYTDGFALPKEMIQNADDALASEVKFLWDERGNWEYRTGLFDENMSQCQGPALWCYNNSIFSQEDLKNITKLGGATKESDKVKIGRFGLGFNSVYNLTDVPSFLSEENFLMFDPHTTYLGRAIQDKSQPGIKMDLKTCRRTRQRLWNQFAPYDGIFGCDMKAEDFKFSGTLIRLPLRTYNQAMFSEIRNEVYDREKMKELFKHMESGLHELLLFTQHVQKITLYHLSSTAKNPSEIKELCSVKKTLIKDPLTNTARSQKLFDLQMRLPYEVDSQTLNLMMACSINDAAQNCLTKREEMKTWFKIATTVKRGDGSEDRKRWLVTCYSSNNEEIVRQADEVKSLPLAMVAVNVNQQCLPLKIEGGVFCHLPLPVKSGLPLHVNGCFAVASNRRHLEELTSDDINNRGASWNAKLSADSVMQAYVYAVELLCTVGKTDYNKVVNILPRRNVDTKKSPVQFINAFYKEIVNTGRKVFYDGHNFCSFGEVQFLSQDLLDSGIVDSIVAAFDSIASERNYHVVKLPKIYLDEFSKTNQEIKDKVKNKTWTAESFIRQIFLPFINVLPEKIRDTILIFSLKRSMGNAAVRQSLSDVKCIPVEGNTSIMRKPAELVDPSGECSKLYGTSDARFPKQFLLNDKKAKEALLNLKMTKDELPVQNVLDRAKGVAMIPKATGIMRSGLLLQQLERLLYWNENEMQRLQSNLQDVPFLRIKVRPENWESSVPWFWEQNHPFGFIPWIGNIYSQTFASPDALFPDSQENIVGSCKFIVSISGMSKKLKTFLGLEKKDPDVETVLQQLAFYQQVHLVKGSMEAQIMDVYHFLNKVAMTSSTTQISLNHLLVKDKFMPIQKIAMKFAKGESCLPYLTSLPRQFVSQMGSLIEALQIKEKFTSRDMIDALHEMRNNNERKSQLILEVINALCLELKRENKKASDYGDIYLLDADGNWGLSQDLSYNDLPWFPTSGDQRSLHPDISVEHADRLGVKTSRGSFLQNASIPGIAFGQREELTNRLKRLVEGYPQETILNELLQNADDANATEVHFVLDENSYRTERTLGNKYGELQGPALLVYNNKPFRSKDIEGIQNLGTGSKGNDSAATGQYGVGFNSVYSLTDAPQILTRGTEVGKILCVLDPHCRYIDCANDMQPGGMYELSEEYENRFADVLPAFNTSHFNIDESTMFRFPLRTAAMANASKICNREMSVADMKKLLIAFEKEAKNVLMFLKSVTKISISINSGNGFQQKYSAKAVISEKTVQTRDEFVRDTKQLAQVFNQETVQVSGLFSDHKSVHEVTLTDNNGEEIWLVSQVTQAREDIMSESITEAIRTKRLCLLPSGGIAWKIATSVDRSNTLSNTTPHSERKHRLYCFLPLPVETSMPFHINGHFALDETRRGLWNEPNGGYRTDWNDYIMGNVVAAAHNNLAEYIQQRWPDKDQLIYSILPSDDQSRYLHTFFLSAYKLLREKETKTLSTRDCGWYSLKDCENGLVFFRDVQMAEDLNRLLEDCGFPVTTAPVELYDRLIEIEYPVEKVNPENILSYFRQYNPPSNMIEITPFGNVESVIKLLQYCDEHSENNDLYEWLAGTSLCVTENGTVQRFCDDDPIYHSDYCDLLPSCKDLFLNRRLHHAIFETITAVNGCEFLKPFKLSDLAQLLYTTLDESTYKQAANIEYNCMGEGKSWWILLWKFIEACKTEDEGNMSIESNLGEWSILPVIENNIPMLYPLKRAKYVMNWMVYCEQPHLTQLIKGLKLPQINESFFIEAQCPELNNDLTCSLLKPQLFIEVLAENLRNSAFQRFIVEKWTASDKQKLLSYFASYVDKGGKLSVDNAATIRHLPIHESVQNKYISIPGNGVYIIPDGMPYDGLMDSTAFPSFLIKSRQEDIVELHKAIGCIEKTEVELYTELVIPVLHLYTTEQQLIHLRYLNDSYINKTLSGNRVYHGGLTYSVGEFEYLIDVLKSKLATTQFLPNRYGELHSPRELYSHKIPVFEVMLSDDKFPAEEYISGGLLSFFVKLGLRNSVQPDELLDFAEKIECEGLEKCLQYGSKSLYEVVNDEKFSVEQKAQALVMNVFHRDDLTDENWRKLREVRFIPEDKDTAGYKSILPVDKPLEEYDETVKISKNAQQKMIPFSGSVESCQNKLCWSRLSVLPYWASPPTPFYRERLNTYLEPPASEVAMHCKNVCCYLAPENMTLVRSKYNEILQHIMLEMYRFLKGGNVSTDFSVVPCVFIPDDGGHFVYPWQVLISLTHEEQIVPYLFKLPEYCSNLQGYLKRFGVSDRVTIHHYKSVLSEMARYYSNQKLKGNELISALSASEKLFNMVDDYYAKSNEKPEKLRDVHFLTNDYCLRKASEVYYIDDSHLIDRVNAIGKPILCDSYKENKFSTKILIYRHAMYRLDGITDIHTVSELIKECLSAETKANIRSPESGVYALIKNNLCDETFHMGLFYLLRHAAKGKIPENFDVTIVSEVCSRFKIMECENLETELTINGTVLEGSKTRSSHFVSKEEDGTIEIFFSCPRKTSLQSWLDMSMITQKPSKLITDLFSKEFKSILPFREYKFAEHIPDALLVKDGLLAYLKEWGIQIDDDDGEPCSVQQPGEYIPMEDHFKLSNRFASFRIGELVGYKQYEPLLYLNFSEEASDQQPTFIYGKIRRELQDATISAMENSDHPSELTDAADSNEAQLETYFKAYMVDVGLETGPAKIYTYDLYKLLRFNDKDDKLVEPDDHVPSSVDTKTEIANLVRAAATLSNLQDGERIILRLIDNYKDDNSMLAYIKEQWHNAREQRSRDNVSGSTDDNYSDESSFDVDVVTQYLRQRHKQHVSDRRQANARLVANGPSIRYGQTRPNTQPAEAKRWFRQAGWSLKSAVGDVQGGFHSMAIFKCHMACEQGLRAMIFAVDSSKYSYPVTKHRLYSLACCVENCPEEIKSWALELTRVYGDRNRLLYPDILEGNRIPHEVYGEVESRAALDIAEKLVKKCGTFVNSA